MRTKNFILPIALLFIALFFGCKKDDFVETPGVCPEVIATSPVDGATSVVLDKIITVTFNEAMNPSTITTSSLIIMQGEGLKASATTPVLGTITYSGTTASFTPSSPLAEYTNFYGTVTTSVKDPDGNALQVDYEWTFSTSTIPAVTSVIPLNLATNVPLNQAVSFVFSEAMNASTITAANTFTLTQGGTATAGTVTYSGTTGIFTPSSNLLPNTLYTGTISTAAKNLAGNSIPSNYVWTFTTSKIPSVLSVDPLDWATNVVLNKVISAKFSELMNASTITATSTFTLKQGTNVIAGSVSYTDSDSTAVFTPSSNLLPNKLYTATISTAAKNTAGNAIASNYVWRFTTSKIPTVLSTDPVNLAANVALDKVISAKFSELMNAGTITAASTFTLQQGTNVIPGSVSYTDSDSTAIFTPTSNLQLGRTYKATISTAAKNTAGNSIASNYVWTFSTGTAIPPEVILTSPLDLAIGVTINKVITANFSEAMNTSTITAASTFTLMQGTTSIPGTVTYSGTTARFTPSSNLLEGTTYEATISTDAKNLAGTALESDYVWSFTTGTVIVPEVILTDPLDLDIDVALDKVITADFSEAMNASTITAASTFTLMQGTTSIAGSVTYSGITASFTPSSNLLEGTTYEATISTAAKNLAGTSIESNYIWSFTTIEAVIPPPSGLFFGVFGGNAGITNQGLYTVVNGTIGTTAASTLITGFTDDTNGDVYTVTPLNNGLVAGGIYTAAPPPGNATKAAIALEGLNEARDLYLSISPALMPGGAVNPGAGELGGLTLAPGIYTASSTFNITNGDLTLDAQGDPDAKWYFQAPSSLTVGDSQASSVVFLSGVGNPNNVYWYVGSTAVINYAGGGVMVGNIIANSGVTLSSPANSTNASVTTLNGRAISLVSAVTMVNTVINVPTN